MSGQQIGAIGGGVAGSYFGPAGTVIGAGVGGVLGGMFDSSPDAPTFSDINLQTANPALYAELMKESALADQATALYNQRMQGPTFAEKAQVSDQQSQLAHQLAARGALGSSVGANQQSDVGARLNSQLAKEAFQQQQALLQQAQQAHAQYTQMYAQAQNQVMQPQLLNYQNAMGQQQAGNQFYSGLLNGGMQLYGNQQNAQTMADAYAANKPSYYGPMNNQQGSPYQMGSQYGGNGQGGWGYNMPPVWGS